MAKKKVWTKEQMLADWMEPLKEGLGTQEARAERLRPFEAPLLANIREATRRHEERLQQGPQQHPRRRPHHRQVLQGAHRRHRGAARGVRGGLQRPASCTTSAQAEAAAASGATSDRRRALTRGRPIELPVSHIKQAPGLCGAATAQMMLHYKGLAGTTPAVQLAIFTDIQNATPGMRPAEFPGQDARVPAVAHADVRQVHGRTEIHLLVLLAAGGDRDAGQCVAWPWSRRRTCRPTSMAAAERILDAVDRGFPPAVLVSSTDRTGSPSPGYVTGTGPRTPR